MKIPLLILLLFVSAIAYFHQKTQLPQIEASQDLAPRQVRLRKILESSDRPRRKNEAPLSQAFAQASDLLKNTPATSSPASAESSDLQNYPGLPGELAEVLKNPNSSPDAVGQAFIKNVDELRPQDFEGRLSFMNALRDRADVPKSLRFLAALRQLQVQSSTETLDRDERAVIEEAAAMVAAGTSAQEDLARLYEDVYASHPSSEAQDILRAKLLKVPAEIGVP